jgi:hypothetical protein
MSAGSSTGALTRTLTHTAGTRAHGAGDKEREMALNVGSESCPLSRNMFGMAGKGDTGGAPLLDKISELSAQTPC